MREVLLYLLPCVYAFLACIGFSMLFNIHGAGMLICAGGGALGWLCYLLTGPLVGNDIIQSFFAALVISAWSEVMARLRKCPVTSYLLVALFPLVPGGGIYYTMEHALNGDTELFLDTLMHTLGLAGALAVGVVTFGNRSFDNALAELCVTLETDGFHTVAAAAFVGRHAFTDRLAAGRPDGDDLRQADAFARCVAERVRALAAPPAPAEEAPVDEEPKEE